MPSEVMGVKVVTGNGSDIQGCDKRLHPVVNLELTSALVLATVRILLHDVQLTFT